MRVDDVFEFIDFMNYPQNAKKDMSKCRELANKIKNFFNNEKLSKDIDKVVKWIEEENKPKELQLNKEYVTMTAGIAYFLLIYLRRRRMEALRLQHGLL